MYASFEMKISRGKPSSSISRMFKQLSYVCTFYEGILDQIDSCFTLTYLDIIHMC